MKFDLLMQLCRSAGVALANPGEIPELPSGALPDRPAREKLVMSTEQQINDDIHAIQDMLLPSVIACVRADHSLVDAASDCFTTVSREVATGIAMRFYSGFLDMAKTLRKDVWGEEILPEQRGKMVEVIHEKPTQDKIYCAGVCFGWWGIERRSPQEAVVEDGISEQHKQLYLAEYHEYKKSVFAASGL